MNHPDFGVRILARRLAEHWGLEVTIGRGALPAFYELVLPSPEVITHSEILRERPFGPPLVSDPAAWCEPFAAMVEKIASIAGVSEVHIQHRVQQLIDGWGGVQVFGSAGAAQLRGTLQQLGLQLIHFVPHFVGGLRALRHVTGELESAGRISPTEIDELLDGLAISPAWPRIAIDRRPDMVIRPSLPRGFRTEDEAWLAQVGEDLSEVGGASTILAEVTQFIGRSSFTTYEWSRIRLLGSRLPPDRDPVSLFESLPDSGFLIRRVDRPGLGTLPRFELTLNPILADRLGWQFAADGFSQWFDANAQLVATAFCWRDGSPDGQTHGDCLYGEGAAIVLTDVGRAQAEALIGPRRVESLARRARAHGSERQERFAATMPPNAQESSP